MESLVLDVDVSMHLEPNVDDLLVVIWGLARYGNNNGIVNIGVYQEHPFILVVKNLLYKRYYWRS